MQTIEASNNFQEQLDVPKTTVLERDTLALPEGFSDQPFAKQTITFASRSKEVPVIAEIDDALGTFIVSPPGEDDPSNTVWLRKIIREKDGSAKNLEDPRRISTDSDTVIAQNDQGQLQLHTHGSYGVGFSTTTGHKTRITVAESSQPKMDKTERLGSRTSRFMRRAAGLLLATSVVLPTYAEVHDRLHNPDATKIVMDTTEQLSIERATELARTMEDLQNDNTEAVKDRAEAYREKNADQLPTKELVSDTREAIDRADTHDEVVQALQGFMGFYGKKVELLSKKDADSIAYKDLVTPEPFDQTADVGDTKGIAQSTVSALNFLPKKLLEKADFSRYLLSNGCNVASGDRVVVGAESTAGEFMSKGVGVVSGNDSKEWRVLHEIAHTFQHDIHYFDDFKFTHTKEQSEAGEMMDDAAASASHIFKTLLRSPDEPSAYAHRSGREKDAEIFAGTLVPNPDDWQGLHSPKDGTWFESKSNKYMLKKLIDLDNSVNLSSEGAYFSDWLMAQKLGLVKKY